MSRWRVVLTLSMLFLIGLSLLSRTIQPVKSTSTTITVPDDYLTIQEAIAAASDGDTVFVRSGIYQQPVVDYNVPHMNINKSISLIGQDRSTTVIQAYKDEIENPSYLGRHIIQVEADNVVIKGFTFLYGIFACWILSSGCQIIDNNFIENDQGVTLSGSGNTVTGNYIWGNDACGIAIHFSSDNVVIGNVIGETIFAGMYVVSGNNNTILKNEISGSLDVGLGLDECSSGNIVKENQILNNGWVGAISRGGIVLWLFADSNYIVSNNVSGNAIGVLQSRSNGNHIYHNSFTGNGRQVVEDVDGPCSNIWNDVYHSGGNFWDNYVGLDEKSGLYQNLTGTDGIGDTPYVINENNIDYYPLIMPYVFVLGDLNHDGKVNMVDIALVASAFGSTPDSPRWNPEANINQDGIVDLRDIAVVAKNFMTS